MLCEAPTLGGIFQVHGFEAMYELQVRRVSMGQRHGRQIERRDASINFGKKHGDLNEILIVSHEQLPYPTHHIQSLAKKHTY